MVTNRTCPVKGCSETHERSKLMCLGHWWSIPKPMRGDLWDAYRNHGVFSDEYLAVREACVAFCENRAPRPV